jgi:hypothetical protein
MLGLITIVNIAEVIPKTKFLEIFSEDLLGFRFSTFSSLDMFEWVGKTLISKLILSPNT